MNISKMVKESQGKFSIWRVNRMSEEVKTLGEAFEESARLTASFEVEYPLRKGSLIRTEEGILFSRAAPGSIPILTESDAEMFAVLDAYGDALTQIKQLREELEQAHNENEDILERSIKRKYEIEQLNHQIRVVDLANETLGRYVREGKEELKQVKKERDALLEGLKWYADEDNWRSGLVGLSNSHKDQGDHARSILSQYAKGTES